MSLTNPQQRDYDKLSKRDMVFIRKRGILYTWFRHVFLNKPKITIMNPDTHRKELVYSEDCTILYELDMAYYSSLNNVDARYKIRFIDKNFAATKLAQMYVTGNSLGLQFKHGVEIAVPLNAVKNLINTQASQVNFVQQNQLLDDCKKFSKYTEQYFKNKLKQKNINEWVYTYCNICGKPIKFIFNDNNIDIHSECECGCTKLNENQISYSQFCDWFNCQTNTNVKLFYKQFWK